MKTHVRSIDMILVMYVLITLSRNMCYTCTLTPTRLLGTPTEETWPNITHLPDYKVSVIFE